MKTITKIFRLYRAYTYPGHTNKFASLTDKYIYYQNKIYVT